MAAAGRERYALVILDAPIFTGATAEALLTQLPPELRSSVLLLADDVDRRTLGPLLLRDRLSFVVSRDNPRLARELVITANKLITGELFGLDKYLTWGSVMVSRWVASGAEVAVAADAVGEHAASLGLSRRVVAMARTVADELLSNAIKQAARVPAGTAVAPVALQYACDGELFGVSVADSFGALDADTVTSYLVRCFSSPTPQDGDDGAGLGMFMAFEAVRQMVFNLAPGRRTEVMGLIAVSRLADPGKSLYLFRECAGPPAITI